MTLLFGMVLDAFFGEPKWLWSRVPHPAVIMGKFVKFLDVRMNSGSNRQLKGQLACAVLAIISVVVGLVLGGLPWFIEAIIVGILIAQKSLSDHVLAVARALRLGLEEGRAEVAMIVGRDTTVLDESGVARSAIESAAENLSDGVVAPIFWFVILGLPGILLYKVINTADSMIGYKTEKYRDFGQASAKFDDVLNYIPARITAIMLQVVFGFTPSFARLKSDATRHRSPNAGWPEAAMAQSLGFALSGPRVYDGKMTDDVFVNPNGKHDLNSDDIELAVGALWRVWFFIFFTVLIGFFLF